jgi:hypothetical protein
MEAPPPGVARISYLVDAACAIGEPLPCTRPAAERRAGKIITAWPSILAKRHETQSYATTGQQEMGLWAVARRHGEPSSPAQRGRSQGDAHDEQPVASSVRHASRLRAFTMHLSAPPAWCCQVPERLQAQTLALPAPEWLVVCTP